MEQLKKTIKIGTICWLFNFVLNSIVYHLIGGSSFNGYIENATYYVAIGRNYSEVSKIIWYINYIQEVLIFVLLPFPFARTILSMITKNDE